MKIIAVRHGETEGNIARRVESRSPGQLTYVGSEQARTTAYQLRNEPIAVVYCSNLQRCVDTALFIAEYHPHAKFVPVHQLRERNHGIFEGGSWDDVPHELYEGEFLDRQIPGGESWRDVEARLSRFLDELYELHADQTVLLVTHVGPVKALRALLTPMPLRASIEQRVQNASVHYFEMNAPFTDRVR